MSNPAEPVSFVIRHTVKATSRDAYEAWLRRIMPRAASYPGHQGVHVTRPAAGLHEYTIVVRFASLDEATRWVESDDRRQLVAEVEPCLETTEQTGIEPGIEFWFTPPAGVPHRAVAWKQWLMTTSVIWPLTMIVPAVYASLFDAVPALAQWGIRHGIVATTITALVTYLIMPRYVRLVSGWLYR